VWSSTQVPFMARSGVAHVLQIPESHVRVIVPLLGGGFGSKCDVHFEGHVAALARVAGRPVKLVFSREEEFVAPDHRREGIVIERGWWPSFGVESGAYVKLNADGTGTIVTGAQENGSGAVMGLPLLAAEALGMKPEDFSILYQDTDAGPWDMGSSGSQTTFNNGRAVVEAAGEVRRRLLDLASDQLEVASSDLQLADGEVRVKGAPQRAVSIA